MTSIETLTKTSNQEDLFPYTNWEDIYSDLDNLCEDLIQECVEHISELENGTYLGRHISAEAAQGRIADYLEEVNALQSLDINNKQEVLRVMRMHQKRKNAAEDFMTGRNSISGPHF